MLTHFLPLYRNKSAERGGIRLVKNALRQVFFCQESLTKSTNWIENRVNYNVISKMGFGKLGTGFGGALAIGAAVAAMPDRADAGEFADYCAPIANGEVLETELTPQNMAYIFDDQGRVHRGRADELTQYFGDGISEECGAGDVGAYVTQIGERVLLEIYPPGQYPLGIDPTTFQEIQANYSACIAEELAVVDKNGNGRVDPSENVNLYRTGEMFCNEELQGSMRHAGEMAASQTRIAALNAQQAAAEARISAITTSIINGARAEVGLN
ncbi:hypothetical protein EGN72_03095 [Pseudorhodobacter sp. E13]|uniref:hypothetical protein n=1 Tax=Pseudorhodobacter sp. E13 TaxID=2487931 RepID=UPI000F8DB7D6|nr:hypothetical protein [Pseudorhodobacter sp. E13]RUS63643.1 hypothetical protein EGN72_03095 [Pseudorhodobacter sp. E13]